MRFKKILTFFMTLTFDPINPVFKTSSLNVLPSSSTSPPPPQVEQLTKDWTEGWRDKKELLKQYSVDINRDRAGFLINSLQPHLVTLDGDVLSTGVVFYHLRV